MTDRDKFIAAILAEPADDTPRLVYADWLDEHGFGRWAAFIRLDVGFDYRSPDAQSQLARLEELWGSWPDTDDPRTLIREHCPALNEWVVLPEHLVSGGEPRDLKIAVVRRGFVSEVRCDTATLLGGACGRCEVEGVSVGSFPTHAPGDPPAEEPCKTCKGTGRVEGVAKALFAAHPVTTVVLTDLQPYHNGAGWCWFDPDRTPPHNDVPANANPPRDVYRLLTGHLSGRSRWRGYDSQAAATDALSRAAVAHCRGLAGLPPLVPS